MICNTCAVDKPVEGDVEKSLKKIFEKIAEDYEYDIIAMEVMPDHVHLFVGAKPSVAPSDIVSINIKNAGLKILSDGQEYTPGDDWRSQNYVQCQSQSQEQRGKLFNYALCN